MDARLKYLATVDKQRLYYELWLPNNPKAIIVFVHGLGDHLGRYAEFAKYMLKQNFAVCLYDQRGHGRSSGRRAHCKTFSDFTRDLLQVIEMVQEERPTVPVFLAGHSFGGQIVLNFAARYSKGLRGIIALSPNIEPLTKIPNWKKKFAAKISNFIPIIKIDSDIKPADLSHNEAVVSRAKEDPLMSWHVTVRLGNEILKNVLHLPQCAFQIRTPCLFLQGGSDKITSLDATKKFFNNILLQNKEMRIYQGFYHELLNETGSEGIFHDIETWLNAQLASLNKRAAKMGAEEHYDKTTLDFWRRSGPSYRDGAV